MFIFAFSFLRLFYYYLFYFTKLDFVLNSATNLATIITDSLSKIVSDNVPSKFSTRKLEQCLKREETVGRPTTTI